MYSFHSNTFKMADTERLPVDAGAADKGDNSVSPQKRKSTDQPADTSSAKKVNFNNEGEKPVTLGKISMNLGGPMKKPGISMNLGGSAKKPGISMNLGTKKTSPAPVKIALPTASQTKEAPVVTKTTKVASVFNDDSEKEMKMQYVDSMKPDQQSDEEEMPIEAKMRMRNIGRETPTAAGPNSFGKGNLGFCDRTKMIERDMKRKMEDFGDKADGLK